MRKLYLGIDVGGTNIKLGAIDSAGRIICRTNLATKAYTGSPRQLIVALANCINSLMLQHKFSAKNFDGIGIGLPGLINPLKGVVDFLPNIPGWSNVPLKRILEQQLKIPVYLENDVNMITLAEWQFGAGRGFANLICMTLGTGVGGGLILNNELYRGEGFVAGELGHVPLNESGPRCNCGGRACFERTVGNQALLRRIKEIFRKELTIEAVHTLASQGNPRALKFWKETAVHIGNGLVGVVNLLNPPLIVIGGGVANNERFLFKTISRVIKTRAMKVQGSMVKIVRAKLGNDAGIIGAQVLVRNY